MQAGLIFRPDRTGEQYGHRHHQQQGGPGAGLRDATTSDALKGYVVFGVTAGLTTGVCDNWTDTQTGASDTSVASGNTDILATAAK